MFNNNTQYINMIRTQQNLKIDYQLLEKNTVSKSEQSIFLLDSNNNSNDSLLKIRSLENSKVKTFISALCEDEDQVIQSNDIAIPNDSKSVYFDTKNNIVVQNTKVARFKNIYNNSDIDYLLSPFSILHNVLANDLHSQSLNLLILNDKIYSIILDENKRLSYSCIKLLTPYEDIDNSSFFDDEISKQKLYEEMYILELQTIISDITKDFYNLNNNAYFVENINIYYNIKQLSTQQISTLSSNLMINVNYNQISIDSIIYSLVKKQHINKQNLIQVRVIKSTFPKLFTLTIVFLLTAIIAAGVFYYKQIQLDEKLLEAKKVKEAKIKAKLIKDKIKEIALPNHININKYKVDFIVNLFDTIGNDSVLKEIQLQEDESTLVYNYINKDSYEINLQPALKKLYENSENVLTSQKNDMYTAIISNTKIINPFLTRSIKLYKPNKKNKFLSEKEARKYLHNILEDSIISLRKTKIKKYTSYKYNVISTIKTPEELYNSIQKLNNQYYSISLDYPLEFVKSSNKLKVSYTLKFNQINKSTTK